MFNENWNFTYYSNWQFTFEISLDSYEFLDFWVVDLRNVWESIMWVITSPINSFISIIGIITPFWEEPRNYCLFGTIVPYENHRMYKWSEFYNEMNVISYFFLFCAYAWLFSLGLKIRDFKKWWSKNED